MGKTVKFKTLVKRHPDRIIIAVVALRDALTKRAKGFRVLQTVKTVGEMKKAVAYYQSEGYNGVFAIPNFRSEEKTKDFPTEYTALMYRKLYHEEEEKYVQSTES